MAAAFAERELARRSATDRVGVVSGGTTPADRVHPRVVRVMEAVGIDLGDRTPRASEQGAVRAVDLVVTMGCSVDGVCLAGWAGETRDWDLPDPAGMTESEVRVVRGEIERRVVGLVPEVLSLDDHGRP